MSKTIDDLEREARVAKTALDDAKRREEERKRSALQVAVATFERDKGVHVSLSDDYASMKCQWPGRMYDKPATGGLNFYYGYEKTFCPKHGSDQAACENADCDEKEWAFVVEEGGVETMRVGESGLSPEEDEPATLLLCGIGIWIAEQRKVKR